MWNIDQIKNSDNIKEMMYFYDVLNNLDTPILPKKNTGKDKIPVILSADDN